MMFKQPLLIPLNDTEYELYEPFVYEWDKSGRLFRLTIPKGFVTDVASVPQIAWSLGFKPDGLHRAAAVVHDFLYQRKGYMPPGAHQTFDLGEWRDVNIVWTREECDKMFAILMREAGSSKVKRRLMYLAVRWFGGPAWNS